MENSQIVRAYPPVPERAPSSDEQYGELIQQAREWMYFFEDTLTNHLSGKQPESHEHFTADLHNYFAWTEYTMRPMIAKRAFVEPGPHERVLDDFQFHEINGPMTYLWHQLVFSDQGTYTDDDLSNVQTHLAASIVPTVRRLRSIQTKEPNQEQATLIGKATEFDAAIALIEFMKTNTGFVALAAPDQYEKSSIRSSRNMDFIVSDTIHHVSHGAQVKTSLKRSGEMERYDPHFVSLIDGVTDLGNTESTKTYPYKAISFPGLLSLQYLSERSIKDTPPVVSKMDYMRLRLQATEMTRGHKSYLGQAVINIANRMLPHLQPPSSKQELP